MVIPTPDQRVRVFVSSTLGELTAERAAAREAIEELRLIPVLFELGARPYPPRSLYRSYLEQSDVFVGIYGERYGWVGPGMEISGLEDEYRLAKGKPRLLYVKARAPAREERLSALIASIEQDAQVSYRAFADSAELRRVLAEDLALLLSERFQAPRAEMRWERSKLPAPVDRFVGREAELGELEQQLRGRSGRLITVTGPGGVGKTRLALEAAGRARAAFADGAHLVPLSDIFDPELVVPAIQSNLELADSGRPPLEVVVDGLRNAELLLVVDNFEQVLPAASAIARLLEECPRLMLLVTSRAVLRVKGEREFPLPPLGLPTNGPEPPEAEQSDAVALFVERARNVRPPFALTDENRGAVAQLCRRLDGLPLAIELAAAQVRLLPPQSILERLEHRLALDLSAGHAYPDRQQTLRAAIDWSFRLLDQAEKALFSRTGVFRGGWTLDALDAICGAPPLEVLASLVEKSLVVPGAADREPRFSMLPTIHEYALERLKESPDAEEVHRRHAEFYLAVAKSANLDGAKIRPGGQRLELAVREQENMRAALEWSLAAGSTALGLELATAIEQFWVSHDPREATRWFEALLEHPGAGAVAPAVRGHALRVYGSALYIDGDHEAASRYWEESLAVFERLHDEHGCAVLMHRVGISALGRGEFERARELVEASQEIHRRTGDRWGLAQTVGTLGAMARDAGEQKSAERLIAESAALAREVGVRWWEGGMLAELAALSLNAGRVEEAELHARESLALAEQVRDRAGRVFGVGLLAGIAAERGQVERAGRLWGAIEDEDAVAPLGGWRRHRAAFAERIRKAAGPAFEAGYAEGRALTIDDAVSTALSVEARVRMGLGDDIGAGAEGSG